MVFYRTNIHYVELTKFWFLQKALQYACSNAVVCDTMEEARRVAFGGSERRKVIIIMSCDLHPLHMLYLCIGSLFGWYIVQ